MPPPPTPTPTPTPTQTVVVNLPPELLHKLTEPQTVVVKNLPPELLHKLTEPSSFFWLGPLATVIAALFALAAAAVAYRAVTRQINANAKAVQDQIDATATQQQKNREAEWARLRRKEVLELLEEAKLTARKLASIAISYSLVAKNPESFNSPDDQRRKEQQVAEFAEISPSVPILMDKLEMHELTAVSTSLSQLEIEAGAVIQDIDYSEWTVPEKEQAVFAAIKDALQKPASS